MKLFFGIFVMPVVLALLGFRLTSRCCNEG
jgi:hypothetical protein